MTGRVIVASKELMVGAGELENLQAMEIQNEEQINETILCQQESKFVVGNHHQANQQSTDLGGRTQPGESITAEYGPGLCGEIVQLGYHYAVCKCEICFDTQRKFHFFHKIQ